MKHSPYALNHISPSVENTHFSKIKNAGNLNPVVTTPAISFRNENKKSLPLKDLYTINIHIRRVIKKFVNCLYIIKTPYINENLNISY